MPNSIPSFLHSAVHKGPRVFKRASLAVASLVAACSLLNPAHATYPGENGVIVFDTDPASYKVGRISAGGSPVLLANGHDPKASPNGKKIAFLRGGYLTLQDIYVMDMDGSNIVKLTNAPVALAVTWLPDGSRLAYAKATAYSAVAELWTMKADGSDSTFVKTLGTRLAALDWAPKGSGYSYVSEGGLYASDGVNPVPILRYYAGFPAWAPDAVTVLYGDTYTGLNQLSEFKVGVPGRTPLPPHGVLTGRNAISPDGKFIVGGVSSNVNFLTTRARTGLPFLTTSNVSVDNVDWARVPKNCDVGTPSGSAGVLAGDVNWYADQCAVALLPGALAAGGVTGQALSIGPDGRLYGRMLVLNPLGGEPVWGDPYVIPGGGGAPGGINPTKVAIAAAKDGSFQVVIINSVDQAVYHAMQYPNGTWSGFNRLDGAAGASSFQARDVAIAINGSSTTSPGNAQVIANGLIGGDLYHRVRWPSGAWTGFSLVPGGGGINANELAIASSDDLYTNVLAVTTAADGSQGQVRQVIRDPGGNWGGWVTMPLPVGTTLNASSDVAVTRTTLLGNPVAQVMVVDASGNANLQVRNNPNQVSSWQGQATSELITTQSRTASISAGGGQTTLLSTRVYPQ